MQSKTKFFRAGAGRAACAALLAGALAAPTAAFAAAGFPDSDVDPGGWYVGHVQEAVDRGIVRGFPDGTFRPDEGVTRAQVAEMLCRAEGAALPEGEVDAENRTPWSDVEPGAWYTHAMNWAYETGVFTGDGDGTTTARPEDGILREEMAKAVASYMAALRGADVDAAGMAWPGGEEGTLGLDELSPWAEPFFKWLANQGVMGGHTNPDGTTYLEAKGRTTRAQFAKLAVKASSWTGEQAPGAGEQAEIAAVEALDVTHDGATLRAVGADGEDITALCEFSAGGAWQAEPRLSGLSPDTEYTALARVKAAGGRPAGEPLAATFRTLAQPSGGDAQQKAEAPADILIRNVGQTSFNATPRDARGLVPNDWTCEYRIDDGAWIAADGGGYDFKGLKPGTEYAVSVRQAAHDGLAASDAVTKTVRTQAAQGESPSPDAVWVTEYTPVMTHTSAVDGTGAVDGVYDKWEQNGVTGVRTLLQTDEMRKTKAARAAYFESLGTPGAPFNDAWDTVSGDTYTTVWRFVKTGGHWETPKSDEERRKLFSYSATEAKDYPTTVKTRKVVPKFTTEDGRTWTSKKAAFGSGSEIVGCELGSADSMEQTHDLGKLIRAAGGDPDAAWCYTGETLATMDGNDSNQ